MNRLMKMDCRGDLVRINVYMFKKIMPKYSIFNQQKISNIFAKRDGFTLTLNSRDVMILLNSPKNIIFLLFSTIIRIFRLIHQLTTPKPNSKYNNLSVLLRHRDRRCKTILYRLPKRHSTNKTSNFVKN